MQSEPESTALLDLRGLGKTFRSRKWFGRGAAVVAAHDVSFRIDRGQAVALVGESGSGKSTLARIILRLEAADVGEIRLDGVDVLSREPGRASLAYRRRVQMVFQDPFGSLNSAHTVGHHLARPILRHRSSGPRVDSLNTAHTVEHHLARPILRHHSGSEGGVRARSLELLRTVGLEPAEEYLDRYPYELSGGQRQRVAIARALAVEPDVLVADEPTSMLDVSIRMSVLTLLAQLKEERQLAILLITHDLASARYLADRVLVLYRGRVVEDGPCEDVVQHPAHPYTRELLASIADAGMPAGADPGDPSATVQPKDSPGATHTAAGTAAGTAGAGTTGAGTAGEGPAVKRSPARAPRASAASIEGCPFAARCPDVHDICRTVEPEPRMSGNHRVRCHLYPASSDAP